MKIIISTLFVLFLSLTTAFYPTPNIAAALTSENMSVFHPNGSKTVTMGKEIFSYQTFDGENSQVISHTEITQPSGYEGLLFRKHILQAPEEIYIIKGDFEFAFSQSEQKNLVKEGDIVSIPSGLPFGFQHVGRGEGKVIVVSQSDALPKMLSQVGTLIKDKSSIASADNKLDINEIISAAKKNGIEFLN